MHTDMTHYCQLQQSIVDDVIHLLFLVFHLLIMKASIAVLFAQEMWPLTRHRSGGPGAVNPAGSGPADGAGAVLAKFDPGGEDGNPSSVW